MKQAHSHSPTACKQENWGPGASCIDCICSLILPCMHPHDLSMSSCTLTARVRLTDSRSFDLVPATLPIHCTPEPVRGTAAAAAAQGSSES